MTAHQHVYAPPLRRTSAAQVLHVPSDARLEKCYYLHTDGKQAIANVFLQQARVCEGVDGVRQAGAVGVFVARDQRAQNHATAHFRHEQAGATRNVSCNQLTSSGGSGGWWWLAAVAAATCTPSNRPRDAGVHPRRRAARRWGEGASRRADG